MVVQCCVCKRVYLEGSWEDAADDCDIQGTASHGYCPSCLEDAYAEFRALQCNAAVSSTAA